MKKIQLIVLTFIVGFVACSEDGVTSYKSDSKYSYFGVSDSLGSTLTLDSRDFLNSQIDWNGDIMTFTGNDNDIFISLKYNAKTNSVSDFSFATLFTDGTVYFDEVSVESYTGQKNVSHNLHLKFNQVFTLNTTTNTTSSTVTFPNDIKLTIIE